VEQSQSFQPKGRGKSYSLILPPPNANGDLHLGHALLVAVEDIAIRYHRLRGDRTVFIPGADHAGFETWVVYEKTLAKRGFSRFDFSREQLYQQVWDFVAETGVILKLSYGDSVPALIGVDTFSAWTRMS